MSEERWRTILEFPKYEISDRGNVYNTIARHMMRTSISNYGNTKITLTDYDGSRHTRSVALLVAAAFVDPPNYLSDHIMVLDGDLANASAYNLAWRPRGFAYEYTRQLKLPQPNHYINLPVRNTSTGAEYDSIIDAGIAEGLLFKDIWRATYSGERTYPFGHTFEIFKRV